MGAGWLIAQPALQVFAFWFLLDLVLKVRPSSAVPYLDYFLVAILPWMIIQETLSRSLVVLSDYGGLYQRTLFPLKVLPWIPLLMGFLIYTPVLLAVVGFQQGVLVAGQVLGFCLLLMIWLLPFCYLLAVMGLFFKESRQVVPFLLTLLMYGTPILYTPEVLPPVLISWMRLNPLAHLVAIIEHLVNGLPLDLEAVVLPWGLWLLLLPLASRLYSRAEPLMREEL